MFEKWHAKRKLRQEAVQKAREGYTSWLEISQSDGWKIYEERINRKIELIKKELESNTNLTGEDLKRLQLALQVWNEVKRVPKELENNAKSGVKNV